jgi:hypothetical protein
MKFTGGKDTDKYFLESLDDRELFTAMQTNKEYLKLGQDFFKKRMETRYPILSTRKPKNVTWFKYYIDNVFYIYKLKEDYNLDYYNIPSFYPKTIYHRLHYAISPSSLQRLIEYNISFLVENGEYEKAIKYLEVYMTAYELRMYKSYFLSQLLRVNNIPLFEKMANEYGFVEPYRYIVFLEESVKSGKEEVLDYIISHSDLGDSGDIFYSGIEGAIRSGNLETFDYFVKRYPEEKMDWFLSDNAMYGENLELFKRFLNKDFENVERRKEFLGIMKKYSIINIIKEGKLDFLKYAIEMYKAYGGNMKSLMKNINQYFTRVGILDRDIRKYIKELEIINDLRNNK